MDSAQHRKAVVCALRHTQSRLDLGLEIQIFRRLHNHSGSGEDTRAHVVRHPSDNSVIPDRGEPWVDLVYLPLRHHPGANSTQLRQCVLRRVGHFRPPVQHEEQLVPKLRWIFVLPTAGGHVERRVERCSGFGRNRNQSACRRTIDEAATWWHEEPNSSGAQGKSAAATRCFDLVPQVHLKLNDRRSISERQNWNIHTSGHESLPRNHQFVQVTVRLRRHRQADLVISDLRHLPEPRLTKPLRRGFVLRHQPQRSLAIGTGDLGPRSKIGTNH
mmetsp:Transcript_233/g.625  ORF Transcript_233/g.625 Transcript_233/m.625 type:complete len:273 (-) Transcript_233:55-873(-)